MVELISVHIPKTAGMAFRNVLEQVYEPENILFDYDFPFDGSNVSPNIRVIHGHFWVSKYIDYFETAQRITWLRNPIYRVLSHYFFLKTDPGTQIRPDLAILGLLEFAEHPQIRNTMSQFLQGMKLTDFLFVGIQEFFKEDLNDLGKRLQWSDFQPSIANKNRYSEYTGHLYKILENQETLKRLIALNREDIELYELALSLREKRRSKLLNQTLISLSTSETRSSLDDKISVDAGVKILSQHIPIASCLQNALNIFRGEWISKLPGDLAPLEAGQTPSFEDSRVAWAIAELGGVKGQRILELAPLEAGNTYMLEQAEAEQIVAIEANPRAYLKCLIVKEALQLKRSQFLCGKYVEYLQLSSNKFDVCFANGVLYHLQNPVELIALMAKAADQVFIWTHYYDEKLLKENSDIAHLFTGSELSNYEGFQHTLYRYENQNASTFAAHDDNQPYSAWMSRKQIIQCLNYFGFNRIQINFDEPNHPNGPSFAIVAT